MAAEFMDWLHGLGSVAWAVPAILIAWAVCVIFNCFEDDDHE